MEHLPAIYVIRASDASRHSDKLQLILQTLKMENRIEDFTTLDAKDDLSSLEKVGEEDLILIVLTNQLESQKKEIESIVKPLQAKVAEIIVDNVVYDNAFLTFPADLRPIYDRDDKEVVWDSIEKSLKDMFQPRKSGEPERDKLTGNKRLEAVKNHPEYPELLKIKPGTASLYGRYGCGIIFGLIFTVVALILSFVVPTAMDGFGPVGLVRIMLLFFAAVGAGATIWGFFKLTKLGSSKFRKLPALVVDKRMSVSGGGQNSSATTWYYITLEFSDGERQELESAGKLYGTITKDDVGVAYIRDRYLLDYRRLAV